MLTGKIAEKDGLTHLELRYSGRGDVPEKSKGVTANLANISKNLTTTNVDLAVSRSTLN
jgi:hypothetical protein